ncbi:MAG: hypothetical protein ACC707_00250 [Thiohalomonadales bacterium]
MIELDHDGHTLLVTAPSEGSIATGFNDPISGIRDTSNRPEAGAVYIY